MNYHFIYIFICISILFPQSAFSADIPHERSPNYFDDPYVCRGWFCYEDNSKQTELAYSNNSDEFSQNLYEKINWKEVWTLPPEKLKELINSALSWAQQFPEDEQRMLTYLKLQGIAMRRAKRFQEAWSAAILKYPVLDETVERAPTTAATSLEVIVEREDRHYIISNMRKNLGLVLFYSPNCSYCIKEKEILDSFMEKWKWINIKTINIIERPDLVKRYGIQVVPDIWVFGNTSSGIQKSRIKAGLADHAEIERGLVSAWTQWFEDSAYERPSMVYGIQSFEDFLDETQTNAKDR